jgi:hypothetical protein
LRGTKTVLWAVSCRQRTKEALAEALERVETLEAALDMRDADMKAERDDVADRMADLEQAYALLVRG